MEAGYVGNAYQKRGYLIEDFRVFHIKDSTMEPIPSHYHDFNKIILLVSGHSGYIIEGRSYDLVPRDIVFVSAGEIHRPVPDMAEPYERIVIYISPDFLSRLSGDGDEQLSLCFKMAKAGSSVMHAAPGQTHDILYHMDKLEKAVGASGFMNDLYSRALFAEFMILLNRAILSKEVDRGHQFSADEKIVDLLKYINNHLSDDLSIDILAQRSYLSRYYLMRRFKAAAGCSIHQYIQDKRLLLAKNLLLQDGTIQQISMQCGFKDYTTFARAFKKAFSCTPGEYRERYMEEKS